jgi:hypothetical protein
MWPVSSDLSKIGHMLATSAAEALRTLSIIFTAVDGIEEGQ